MRRFLLFSTILLMLSVSLSLAATVERPMLLRVDLNDKGTLRYLAAGGFDIAYVAGGKFAEIVADDGDYVKLQAAGLNPEIIHEDLVAFYQSRFPLGTDMGGFPTLSEALAFMDSLHEAYPEITTARDSIGYTIESRAIWMMKISDNPEEDEDEPEFFINSLIHAREPMGLEAALRFMGHLCENYGSDSEITDLVDNREFYFVPVVNPDGYEYNRQIAPNGGGMWRKNRNPTGYVDLNRNWGYMWGYDDEGSSPDPDDETYRGMAPFSEPETSALRQLIDSRNFTIILNLHTYGDDFLYPWGYYPGYTPDHSIFHAIGDSACAENGYEVGTPWEVLYYVNGESTDWQYGEQVEKPKIFGFVAEIGGWADGFWPDPSRIPALWNDILPVLMYLSHASGNPYALGPPEAPVLYPIGDVYSDSFVVAWQFPDTVNTAAAFELKEMRGLERVDDDFEGSTANWSLDGFYRSSTRSHSGNYSLFSGSENNYNGTAFLENTVAVQENDTLRFWAWYNIETNFDYAYVQISTDGGMTFTNLEGNITTDFNPYGNNQGNGITGNSSGWVEAIFPLGDYAGESVLLGLRYVTDNWTLYTGFYADEFYPVETFEQEDILSSDIADTTYTIYDREPGDYYYQVRARDEEDQWSGFSNREMAYVHPQTGLDEETLPIYLTLEQNYPNPFNPQTSMSFTTSAKGFAELVVFNILGSRVRTLISADLEAGHHTAVFDGRDDNGKPVAGGVYFYRLQTENGTLTRKMVLIK
jgi:hypothetical protein